MPNTLSDELDTSINEILSKYGMEVANIIQYNNPDDVPDKYAVVRKAAKASLQALILRERHDENELTAKAWHGTDDKEFAEIMNARQISLT